MEVVASLSQGRTAAAQCGLFTHKSVPVIFEPPCITKVNCKVLSQYQYQRFRGTCFLHDFHSVMMGGGGCSGKLAPSIKLCITSRKTVMLKLTDMATENHTHSACSFKNQMANTMQGEGSEKRETA